MSRDTSKLDRINNFVTSILAGSIVTYMTFFYGCSPEVKEVNSNTSNKYQLESGEFRKKYHTPNFSLEQFDDALVYESKSSLLKIIDLNCDGSIDQVNGKPLGFYSKKEKENFSKEYKDGVSKFEDYSDAKLINN